MASSPLVCSITLPKDIEPGQYEMPMEPSCHTGGESHEGRYGYEQVTPLSLTQLEGSRRLRMPADSANGMKLQGENGTIVYTLTAQNGMAIFDGNTAATFTGTGKTALSLAVAEGQTLAPGSYNDTLTFTAKVR